MRRIFLLLAAMAVALVVASGVALAVNKIGTDGPDRLMGTNGDDNLLGRGGNDRLFSLAGDDTLLGGPGKDLVFGGRVVGSCCDDDDYAGGDKNLDGGPGNDGVEGGKGSDNIVGGRGNDWLFEGAEPDVAKIDHLSAGPGNDAVWVLNWSPVGKDILSCGSGFDRVLADRTDVIAADCERVFFGQRNIRAFFEDIPQSFWEGLPPGP
jgi:Ca2+-binding RTX toxin-like protein